MKCTMKRNNLLLHKGKSMFCLAYRKCFHERNAQKRKKQMKNNFIWFQIWNEIFPVL